jgi:hypothetical protein
MSINQVENFCDSLRKYHTVKEITDRTERELKYLNNVCGSTASLKRYLTMYRNYLKEKIDSKKLVEKKPLLNLLLSILKLNSKQQSESRKEHDIEVSQGQKNLREIYDVRKYIDVSIGLLSAVSVYDRIIGLCALTGRRAAEIGTSAILTPINGNNRLAKFEGQLKMKDRKNQKTYEIPILYDFKIINDVLLSIRKEKPRFIDKPLLFNNTASSKISVKVKKHYDGILEGEIQAKNLRSIYALLSYKLESKKYKNDETPFSMNAYFSEILGHGDDDVITSCSYVDFYLPNLLNL